MNTPFLEIDVGILAVPKLCQTAVFQVSARKKHRANVAKCLIRKDFKWWVLSDSNTRPTD